MRLVKGHVIAGLTAAVLIAGCDDRSPLSDSGDGSAIDGGDAALAPDQHAGDRTILPDRPGTDFAGAFCNGTPRVALNSATRTVVQTSGSGETQNNCCNDLGVVTFRLPPSGDKSVFVMATLLVFFGSPPISTPLTVDLANPPKGWAFKVEHYLCDDAGRTEVCSRAGGLVGTVDSAKQDRFSGFVEVTGADPANRQLTLCLQAAAGGPPPPPPQIRNVRLFARGVLAPRSRP